MSKSVYYAMEPSALASYVEHKNNIQAAVSLMSDEQISRVKAQINASAQMTEDKKYQIDAQGNAIIPIIGVLEPKRDICAVLFDVDMTTYSEIINNARAADEDPGVKEIYFYVDSPGGSTIGVNKTANVIRTLKKPSTAIVQNLGASAAYWLASQAQTLLSDNDMAEFGSIGVRTEIVEMTDNGVKRYIFSSSNAPNKVIDLKSDEGKLQIQNRIDKLEGVFIDYVASGRNTTAENVKENYGKGGVLIAKDALAAGMIDGIATTLTDLARDSRQVPASKASDETKTQTQEQNDMETITMTDEQFNAAVQSAADKAASSVTAKFTAEAEAREKARAEEEQRKAGFSALLEEYPEQSAMINAEMAKSDAHADAGFAIKVQKAEKSRLEALKEQQTGADESDKTGKVPSGSTQGTDKSGDNLMNMLGMGGTK